MTQKQIRWWTFGIAVTGSILAYGDKIQNMPFLPGWMVHVWPFVYIGSVLFKEAANIFFTPAIPMPSTDPNHPESLPAHEHAETTTVTPPHVP